MKRLVSAPPPSKASRTPAWRVRLRERPAAPRARLTACCRSHIGARFKQCVGIGQDPCLRVRSIDHTLKGRWIAGNGYIAFYPIVDGVWQ